MEYDLPRGLHDLAQTPAVGPLAPDDVITRVRRGRALRTTAVTVASAAVIIGAAALVNAAPWDTTPVPPATPTPAPTQDHNPEPTPDHTPEPTGEPEPTEPPIVALTTNGDLVLLDPETGEIIEVVTSDESLRGPISLTEDRSFAYPGRDGPPSDVVRVSLADGSTTTVVEGHSPSLSPDSRTLAYIAQYNINHPDDSEWRSLALLDLVTGEAQYLADNTCGGCGRRIDQPAWSLDGSRLYVSAGFVDGLIPSLSVLEVVPGLTPTLDDARVILADSTEREHLGHPTFLPDGRLAFVGVVDGRTGPLDGSGPEGPIWGVVGVVDPATSEIVELHQFPELRSIDAEGRHVTWTNDAAASPTEPTLAIVVEDWSNPSEGRFHLYLWEDDNELRLLVEGIVAVGW